MLGLHQVLLLLLTLRMLPPLLLLLLKLMQNVQAVRQQRPRACRPLLQDMCVHADMKPSCHLLRLLRPPQLLLPPFALPLLAALAVHAVLTCVSFSWMAIMRVLLVYLRASSSL